MRITDKGRRKAIKKNLGKEFFYQDPNMGTEFYVGQTPYYDLTVLMYDTQAGTMREFLVDFHTLKEIYMFAKHGVINPDPMQNKIEKMIHTIKNYTTKDGMKIIKAHQSEVYGSAVLGKVMAFTRDDTEEEVLSLKRIAYLPMNKDHIMGIDTMAIPKAAAEVLIEEVQKLFKNVDIDIDLEGEIDATN
jgi:hypothetical protein